MGFATIQELYSEILTSGKFWGHHGRSAVPTLQTIGRWHDLSMQSVTPPINDWGNLVQNGKFDGGMANWTLGTGWTWAASYASHAVGATSSITQTLPNLITGRTYTTVYTTSSLSGSGNILLSLGGTAGTNRTTAATFTENIVCGATQVLDINVNTSRGCRIDSVQVYEALAFQPYSDTVFVENAPWHGGAVSPDTKHLIKAGITGSDASTVPGTWVLVDALGCYPKIDLNSASLQTLANPVGLPRYADGVGVRAFLTQTVTAGATPYNVAISYTNPASVAGRTFPRVCTGIISGTVGTLCTGGNVADTYGPFLPLADGDNGMLSVQNIQLSAGSGAGVGSLVMCRPLAYMTASRSMQDMEIDFLFGKGSLPRIYDGAFLMWLYLAGAATAATARLHQRFEVGWG